MNSFIAAILLSLLLGSKGDVSSGINYKLPFGSLGRIPSPEQSLLPPTFENPIRDYTVGLVPPPVNSQAPETNTESYHRPPVYQHQPITPHHTTARLSTKAEPSRIIVQQRSGYSIGPVRTAVHHQTHQSTNLLQPQVYQPKTVVYQKLNTHHRHHQLQIQQLQSNNFDRGFVIPPSTTVAIHQHTRHSVPTQQYYAPVTHSVVHQHSSPAHYASGLVQALPTVVSFDEHAHPGVQQSAIVSRPVSSSGVRIIQTYPSVSYEATLPQHGSTLNLGNVKYQPELAYIINEVLHRYHS